LAAKISPVRPILVAFSAKVSPAGLIIGGNDFGVTVPWKVSEKDIVDYSSNYIGDLKTVPAGYLL